MYTRFFGLGQAPFSIAPDPRYLFMSERHREALAHLLYGLDGGGGFVLLTGEIGAGKTTVCRLFLEQIPASCHVAYILNPKQTVIELLQSICDEFGVQVPRHSDHQATVKDFIDPLNAFLLASHAAHRNNILIIDEAQNLSADVLEQLRLLTNLETNERKLLQIILIGQPELRSMLARSELEQLAQRVVARFHLSALMADETAQYITHRLSVAGLMQASPFSPRVMRQIHALARGVPRRINLLCDRALLGAYAQGRQHVDAATVRLAAREVFDLDAPASNASRPRKAYLVAGAAALSILAVSVLTRDMVWPSQSGALRSAGSAAPIVPIVPIVPVMPIAAAPVRPAMTTSLASAGAPGKNAALRTSPNLRDTPDTPVSASQGINFPTGAPGPGNAAGISAAGSILTVGKPVLDPTVRDFSAAIRRLAAGWQIQLDGPDPCRAAVKQAIYCFTSRNGLTEVRQLDRPGVLTLQDDANEKYYALLIGLNRDTALLQIGDRQETVTLAALAKRWRGGFTALWRGPAGYFKPIVFGQRDDAVDWIAARLAAALGTTPPMPGIAFDAAMSARLREFQLGQGLLPDGLPGPRTLIRLASMAGDQGPHLQTATRPTDGPVDAANTASTAGIAIAAGTVKTATPAKFNREK